MKLMIVSGDWDVGGLCCFWHLECWLHCDWTSYMCASLLWSAADASSLSYCSGVPIVFLYYYHRLIWMREHSAAILVDPVEFSLPIWFHCTSGLDSSSYSSVLLLAGRRHSYIIMLYRLLSLSAQIAPLSVCTFPSWWSYVREMCSYFITCLTLLLAIVTVFLLTFPSGWAPSYSWQSISWHYWFSASML